MTTPEWKEFIRVSKEGFKGANREILIKCVETAMVLSTARRGDKIRMVLFVFCYFVFISSSFNQYASFLVLILSNNAAYSRFLCRYSPCGRSETDSDGPG